MRAMPTKLRRGPGRPRLSSRVKAQRRRESAGIAMAAMERLRTDPQGLAERLGTDSQTVRRWLTGHGVMSKIARRAIEGLR